MVNEMKRGHVFIVNENSLPIHLNYMFVGTSAGGKDNNIGLLSDILRVKQDDFIFFYIEGSQTKKGRFFGIFKALDNNVYHVTGSDANQPNLPIYKDPKTKKDKPLKLIYRKLISPYRVFKKGVLEWIALDKLPTYSKELLWMLIYRKYKGGRGNTMLFPWETERLISLIENENNGNVLNSQHFNFQSLEFEITNGTWTNRHTWGNVVTIPLNDIKKSETHFQGYILQNLNVNNNTFFPNIFGQNIVWIGNEVFAGCGMQKIDIITIEKIDETSYVYRIIELKHPKSTTKIEQSAIQLEYYLQWAREDIGGHIIGGRRYNIKPILLSLTDIPTQIVNDIRSLNSISNTPEIYKLDYSLNAEKIL